MTQRTQEIFDLKRKITQDNLDWEREKARQENRERTLNAGINIIAEQLRYNTLAMFYRAFK